MDLITAEHRDIMLANGHRTARGETIEPPPVVKLFTPDAGATWLLTKLDPADPDEATSLRLSELRTVHGKLGLPVERDLWFIPAAPLSAYAEAERIVEIPALEGVW